MTNLYLEDTKEAIIKEQLRDLPDSTIISMYQEITGESFADSMEELIEIHNIDAYTAVCNFHFGKCNFSDDVWTFDGNNNFRSYFNKKECAEDLVGYLEADYFDEVVENYEDEFDLSLLEELEEMGEKEEAYLELKKKHEEETNEFINKKAFFAFSDSQFDEGIEKLGIKKEEVEEKIVSFGYGGYCKKEDINELAEISKKHINETIEAEKDDDFVLGAVYYELGNHEYGYTRDLTDTLQALGMIKQYKEDERINRLVNEAADLAIRIDNVRN